MLDAYGNEISEKIRSLHKGRTMLALIDDEFHLKGNTEESHMEWFISEGWIIDESDNRFNDIVRGYYDHTGVKGLDFATEQLLEEIITNNMELLRKTLKIRGNVYCGLVKGKPGEKYQPIKWIGAL